MTRDGRIVVGAGGFGRELGELIALDPSLHLVGFLDDDPTAPDRTPLRAPYLGAVSSEGHRAVPCLLGVGYPAAKRAVLAALAEVGRPLAPALVHPRAEVGRHVAVSDGVVITAGVVATTDIELGQAVTLHPGALLGHDVVCGSATSVMPGAAISGNVRLGEGVFVGTNAAILQGLTLGAWSTVGAGAVVTRDVPPGATVVGVPARIVS